ncbi:scaffold/adaptor protein [Lithospermum erythrorhizon]|uniref:Scaffold/adaptor protein n=1 Tax=Lithospermum erythrorhizon TaxID=34254 RepID=A0AAV3RE76_LITER
MAPRTLRRRLHLGDIDGKNGGVVDNSYNYDSLNQPLIDYYYSQEDIVEEILDDKQRRERLHWTLLFSNLIAQWAQLLANVVFGAGSLIGRFIPFFSPGNGETGRLLPPLLSSLQEARFKYLKERLAIPFDGTTVEHQDALKQLNRGIIVRMHSSISY